MHPSSPARSADDDASHPAATDHYDCPLCEQTATTQTAIYRHLLVNHRKSEVSAQLLETTARQAPVHHP